MSIPTAPIKRLGTILEEISAELIRQGGADITVRVGGIDAIAKNDPPKRVVLEPSTRTYEASKGTGGALFTRVETVRLHIWALRIEDVEELEELLANAIVKVVAWALRPGPGRWIIPDASQRGWVAVQEISFSIPIMRRELRAPLNLGDLEPELQTQP